MTQLGCVGVESNEAWSLSGLTAGDRGGRSRLSAKSYRTQQLSSDRKVTIRSIVPPKSKVNLFADSNPPK